MTLYTDGMLTASCSSQVDVRHVLQKLRFQKIGVCGRLLLRADICHNRPEECLLDGQLNVSG